jgi:hypothetical protein
MTKTTATEPADHGSSTADAEQRPMAARNPKTDAWDRRGPYLNEPDRIGALRPSGVFGMSKSVTGPAAPVSTRCRPS